MSELASWQFEVEVRPVDWSFPAGPTWLAGWIFAGPHGLVRDLRAWVDDRPFLGLPGLPKPGLDEKFNGRPGPPYAGFVFQVTPHRGANLLRMDARDAEGNWMEFFRTAITVAADAPDHPVPAALATRLTDLVPALLRLHMERPSIPLPILADDVVSAARATPLNSLPNPPFHGALEEPSDTGRLRHGRLAVTGWLAHRTEKIKRLTVIADPIQECTMLSGLARADIGTVFADLPGREHAQFSGQADLPASQGAPALVKVFAELANGEKHLVFAQRFMPRVIAGPDTPLPLLSRVTFARMLWELRGSAGRHGLALGAGSALIAAAKIAWAAYEAEAPRRTNPPVERVEAAAPPQPLRILVVTHNLNFEGAPRLVFELARYLGRTPGSTVRVLSPSEGPMRRLFEEAGMRVEVVDVSAALAAPTPEEFHAALESAVGASSLATAQAPSREQARSHNSIDWSTVDLVLANTLVSFWAIHAATRAGKPSLLYVHESAPLRRFFGPLLPPALFPLVEAAFRDATRVVFTAAASWAVFDHLGDRGNFRLRPSWLGVAAIDAFAAAHTRAELRAKHGVDPAAVVLLNLGTVCERKGQHTFIQAAALLEPELRAAHPGRPVEFVMVGAREDEFLALLRLQVADAGLQRVRFVPETRENFDWLRLADILVCTSFEESSPRVLLEAASFGLPIVSTNVNGIPELVTAEEAGLVRPGDPYQLAGALRRALAAHFSKDTAQAARARSSVVGRFDERVSLPQHLALANEAAARLP